MRALPPAQPSAEGKVLPPAQRLARQPILHPRLHQSQDQGEEQTEGHELIDPQHETVKICSRVLIFIALITGLRAEIGK